MCSLLRLSKALLPCTLYLIIRVYLKATFVACDSLGLSSSQLSLSLFLELTFGRILFLCKCFIHFFQSQLNLFQA